MRPTGMTVTIHRLSKKLFEFLLDTKSDIFETVVEVLVERSDGNTETWSLES